MNNKSEHLAFIKKAGRFVIDCQTDAFNNEEIEILEKWGNWFQALCDEKLTPFTMMQEQFICVFKGENEPVSIEEKAWIKYLGQKRNEEKPGDLQDRQYLPYVDTFHNRELYKKNRKMMFGVMSENHRK